MCFARLLEDDALDDHTQRERGELAMYQAIATPTVRGYHPSSKWTRYQDAQIAQADTLPNLKKKLADHYGRNWKRKQPMYRDQPDGKPIRVGWVVGMRMVDGRDKWLQQDWVSIVEVKEAKLD